MKIKIKTGIMKMTPFKTTLKWFWNTKWPHKNENWTETMTSNVTLSTLNRNVIHKTGIKKETVITLFYIIRKTNYFWLL